MTDQIKVTDETIPQRISDTLSRAIAGDATIKLSSLQNYWNSHGYLTDKQYSMFLNMEERFSIKNIEREKKWLEEYDDEKKKIFKLACEYYKNTIYFRDVWMQHYRDNKYIPKWREYKNMCENKYFMRALVYYNEKPIYNHGDLITLRKRYLQDTHNNPLGMIKGISDKPTFRKGTRIYEIMWFDNDIIHESWQECDIKLYREKKDKKVKNA